MILEGIMSETVYFVLEIVGTVAFAISGAIIGIRRRMDLLGIVILGSITAVGGGIIRDLILGYTPPSAFKDPVYILTAAVTSAVVFIPPIRNFIHKSAGSRILNDLLLIMDSVGLGVFTVIGIRAGYEVSGSSSIFLLSFVGVITGVGGGVLRDVLAREPAYIFYKHFYACASIIGALLCVFLWNTAGESWAMLSGTVCIILLRLAAARFRWKLPRA